MWPGNFLSVYCYFHEALPGLKVSLLRLWSKTRVKYYYYIIYTNTGINHILVKFLVGQRSVTRKRKIWIGSLSMRKDNNQIKHKWYENGIAETDNVLTSYFKMFEFVQTLCCEFICLVCGEGRNRSP